MKTQVAANCLAVRQIGETVQSRLRPTSVCVSEEPCFTFLASQLLNQAIGCGFMV